MEALSKGEHGLLYGVRVVELGTDLAPALAAMMLAEHGAQVVRLVDDAHPPVDPVLDAVTARGKTELEVSGTRGLPELLALADVVIAPLGSYPETAIQAARKTNPGLVTCRVAPFPEGHPLAGLPGHEPIPSMAGYLYNKIVGQPYYHTFAIASVLAGQYAAIGIAAALVARESTRRGQHVETSLFESSIAAQVLQVLIKAGIPRGFVPLRMVGSPFMRAWECSDGRYVYLHITMPKHNAAMLDQLERNGYGPQVASLRALMSEQTRRDPSMVGSISEAEQLKAIYADIFLSKQAHEWETLFGDHLCCIKIRTIDEWLEASREAGMSDATLVKDPVFGELVTPGALVEPLHARVFVGPRSPGRLEEVLARWQEGHGARWEDSPPENLSHPLAGVRVVDLSRIIAGPCAARVLAELGADVLSINSESRLDWSLSFHLIFNAGKRSVTLDFTDAAGKERLWAVLRDFGPDILVHNYRHLDLARSIGVGPEQVREQFPAITYTHVNAYGNHGVWKERPGFEQVVQAVSGIQVGYARGGRPTLLPSPVIDIGCGLLGAFGSLLGLYHRHRTGVGAAVTTHLTSVAVLLQLRQVAAYQRSACLARAKQAGSKIGFDPSREILSGILLARGESVCVAGSRGDLTRWLAFLGHPGFADRVAASIGGRIGRGVADEAPELAALRVTLASRSLARWKQLLEEAGLSGSIGLVTQPPLGHIVEDMAKNDRRLIPLVRRRAHPGTSKPLAFVASPVTLSETPLNDVYPTPLRGTHTREVLGRVGVEAPEGTGIVPYPVELPLWKHAVTFVRWGYFAWRSGNI